MRTRSRRSRVPTCSCRTSCRRPRRSSPSAPGSSGCRGVVAPFGFLSAYDPPTPPQAPAVRRLIALHPAVGRAFNQLARAMHESLDGAAVSASRAARAAARRPSTVRRAAFSGVRAGVVLGSVRRPTAGLSAADGDDGVSFLRLCADAASRAGSARVPRCGRSTCRVHAWIFGRVDRRRLLPGEHRRDPCARSPRAAAGRRECVRRFAPRCQRASASSTTRRTRS